MAPHSSTLAWKIPWMEEPGGLQSMGSLRVGTTERLQFHFSLSCIGEGNGNPLQCSCLENPRNGGILRAAVNGVAQSQTRSDLAAAEQIITLFFCFTNCYYYSGLTFLNNYWPFAFPVQVHYTCFLLICKNLSKC